MQLHRLPACLYLSVYLAACGGANSNAIVRSQVGVSAVYWRLWAVRYAGVANGCTVCWLSLVCSLLLLIAASRSLLHASDRECASMLRSCVSSVTMLRCFPATVARISTYADA